ncbi:MAG TPA: hypothetical protein VFW70_04500 [Methylomirabilota bacterium]|nr:hypothetical protein [Methylomirabilota bacterium]
MIRRVAALTLALPLLLALPAAGQPARPTERIIVLPPLGPEVQQAERDATRAAEQASRVPRAKAPETQTGRELPNLDDDVTTGIQNRALENGLRR